jgi:ADP-ribosylglycohydrolase
LIGAKGAGSKRAEAGFSETGFGSILRLAIIGLMSRAEKKIGAPEKWFSRRRPSA